MKSEIDVEVTTVGVQPAEPPERGHVGADVIDADARAAGATSTGIHPTAVIEPGAELGVDVSVGPYAIIHDGARVGDRSRIDAYAVVGEHTTLGAETVLFSHACIGTEPQDLKFQGERSILECGDRNIFREFVTANRGTRGGGGATRIGSDNLFMAYTHVAHDCQIGNKSVFVNGATLGGHVVVEDWAFIAAFSGIQQFCRIGQHAFLAAYSGVTKDVPPYASVQGNHVRVTGLNSVGLKRRGFSTDSIRDLKKAFKLLFRDGLNVSQARLAIAEAGLSSPEVGGLVRFIEESERGIVR